MTRLKFSEPQQRHVETTLRLIDQAVQRVDYLLERGLRHTGPAGVRSSLDADQLRTLRELFHRLREAANDLYHRYGFHARKLDLRNVLEAETTSLWVFLEDCRPQRMKGYGEMEAATAAVLERDVEELLAIVNQLLDQLRRLPRS